MPTILNRTFRNQSSVYYLAERGDKTIELSSSNFYSKARIRSVFKHPESNDYIAGTPIIPKFSKKKL